MSLSATDIEIIPSLLLELQQILRIVRDNERSDFIFSIYNLFWYASHTRQT